MKIALCTEKNSWNTWFLSQKEASFLQSWEWGEFQRSVGHVPLRVQFEEHGTVVWQIQAFRHTMAFGVSYVYVPLCDIPEEIQSSFFHFCQSQKSEFVRIEPLTKEVDSKKFRVLPITNRRQVVHTMVLSLLQSDEELLGEMHSKTRYNIRLAEKKGVEIREEKNIDAFWNLNEQTTSRDGFKSFPKRFYEKMLELEMVHQLTAYMNEEPIASNILIVSGNTCTYLHGTSSDAFRNVMAPYLLQWKGIELGKKHGCERYDFWGVAKPASKENTHAQSFHRYTWDTSDTLSGVTRFKAGFGGQVVSYPQAVDVPLNKERYRVYQVIQNIRKR